jgi:hypothetical protein
MSARGPTRKWRGSRTLMMVQNEHWNGHPRPASKLVVWTGDPFDLLAGNDRQWLAFEVRQVAEEIIQGLQLSSDRVLQQSFKPASASPANTDTPRSIIS